MIKYLIDVIKFIRRNPYKGNYKFWLWLRNCFYLNWQKPAKWNFDFYFLYKAVKRKLRG